MKRVPKLRRHKPSGQGAVRLNGHDYYLGKWPAGLREPPEHVRAEYDRLLAEWIGNGRQLVKAAADADGPTVAEVILAYIRHAEAHYRGPDGEPTGETDNVKPALRRLRELFGSRPAASIDAMDLEALQAKMVKDGLTRNGVNKDVGRIKRVFRWAASRKLVPITSYQQLALAPALRAGRTAAVENEPVKPVAVEHVEATVPFLPPPVAALVQLQRLTGMRPNEAMLMRGCDLNTTGEVWTYRPHRHKNQHRGQDRVVYLGPQAQAIVKPFLKTDLQAYLFSPREHVEAVRARRAAARKTKRTPSERKKKRKRNPQRQPGERYNRRSYYYAIVRACEKANVPPWSPLQLRHTAATIIRAKYGLEAAQAMLGHSRVETSQIYAEKNEGLASKVAAAMG